MQTNVEAPGGHKIIIADDNQDDCRFLAMGFNSFDKSIATVTVHDGPSLLDTLFGDAAPGEAAQRDFSLLLLDLLLPGRNGLEILRMLREAPATVTLPTVLLTSACSRNDLRRAYALGANAVMIKPPDLTGFERLTQCLGQYWFRCAAITV